MRNSGTVVSQLQHDTNWHECGTNVCSPLFVSYDYLHSQQWKTWRYLIILFHNDTRIVMCSLSELIYFIMIYLWSLYESQGHTTRDDDRHTFYVCPWRSSIDGLSVDTCPIYYRNVITKSLNGQSTWWQGVHCPCFLSFYSVDVVQARLYYVEYIFQKTLFLVAYCSMRFPPKSAIDHLYY